MTISGVQAVERALSILAMFLDKEELNIEEVCRELKLSESTVRRLLGALEQFSLVEKTEKKKYALGYKAFTLGMRYISRQEIVTIARPVMKRIWEECQESVYLSVISNYKRVALDIIIGQHALAHVPAIGRPVPLHCGASSKVLLAYADQKTQKMAFQELTAFTSKTITDPEILKAELNKIRKQGYAVSFSEMHEGVMSMATPVFDFRGEIRASLGVGMPISRYSEELGEKIARLLVAEAKKLSEMLGHKSS